MSIYMPDDLKGRMDRLNDEVNWSSVAQAAFETEIRLHPKWTEDRMSAVIERLRASKEKYSTEVQEIGFNEGKQWAEEVAEYHELVRITNSQIEDISAMIGDPIPWEAIPSAANGDQVTEHEAREFWECVAGDDIEKTKDGFYLAGFMRGVNAVFDEVKGQI